MNKFKVEDSVRLVIPNGMAATTGATAKVAGYKNGFVTLEWDRTNPLCHGQRDGGYVEEDFELIPTEKTDKELADELRRVYSEYRLVAKEIISRGYSVNYNGESVVLRKTIPATIIEI